MKNKVNLWLLIGGGLILFGGIIFVITMSFLDWDFKKLSTVEYETNEYEINEAFKNISIDTSTADITLLPSEDEKVKVVAYEVKNINHITKVESGTLKIEKNDSRKWHEKIQLFNFDSAKITVYLPKAPYESLKIDSSSGDVEIPKNFTFGKIEIATNSSDIKCSASSSGLLKIKVSTGDISLDGAFYKEMDIKSSTGDVELLGTACIEKITLSVGTGDINAKTVTCKEFIASGSSSDISLDNVIATSKMQIDTNSGDISLDRCDSLDINLKASTGDIEGSLLSHKEFDADASTGDVKVPPSVLGKGKCYIRTSTGDINIKIS